MPRRVVQFWRGVLQFSRGLWFSIRELARALQPAHVRIDQAVGQAQLDEVAQHAPGGVQERALGLLGLEWFQTGIEFREAVLDVQTASSCGLGHGTPSLYSSAGCSGWPHWSAIASASGTRVRLRTRQRSGPGAAKNTRGTRPSTTRVEIGRAH